MGILEPFGSWFHLRTVCRYILSGYFQTVFSLSKFSMGMSSRIWQQPAPGLHLSVRLCQGGFTVHFPAIISNIFVYNRDRSDWSEAHSGCEILDVNLSAGDVPYFLQVKCRFSMKSKKSFTTTKFHSEMQFDSPAML